MLIGLYLSSISTNKHCLFFNSIKSILSNNFEIIEINYENINNYNEYYFDLIITFSYYHPSNRIVIWKYRKEIEILKYKNILYIESPPLCELKPLFFRFSLNSIYNYKNELKMNEEYINKIYIKPKQKTHTNDNDNILLLLQNPKQYFLNMTIIEYEKYINDIIKDIRKYTDKKLIIRYKPENRPNFKYNINIDDNNFEFSNKSLNYDCNRCYKCVAHSTNAVSFCAFNGLDIICLSEYNLLYNYTEKNFNNINNYIGYDYDKYFKKLYNCMFNISFINSNYFINMINSINE